MTKENKSLDDLIYSLDERVKELNCIYEVEELLNQTNLSVDEVFNKVAVILKGSMQFPEICEVKIVYRDKVFVSGDFKETAQYISTDIKLQDHIVGWIKVFYTKETRKSDNGPFLQEEIKLLHSTSKRLGHYLMYQRLKMVFNKWSP